MSPYLNAREAYVPQSRVIQCSLVITTQDFPGFWHLSY